MRYYKPLLLFIACGLFIFTGAQVILPAFTGYASPVEKENDMGESTLFSVQDGLHHWTDTRQIITYYFNVTGSGVLSLDMLANNTRSGTVLGVTIAGKTFTVSIPAAKNARRTHIGTVNRLTPGFYSIQFAAIKKVGKTIAAIQSLVLSGTAAAHIQFNARPRRNAASVHLLYPVADTAKVIAFYSELMVPPGADPVHSYFMACGFARGYFGMQVNSSSERRIIFSAWDAGTEGADRGNVAEENKVRLTGKGMNVLAGDFGNEGTGGHSHLAYNWKAGTSYAFMVTALPDSASTTTTYTGYFYMPETQMWKLIAAFRVPKDGKYLHGLYSFIENFDGANGQLQRKAWFGNQWIRNENNSWQELTAASFSYDATGKAGDRIDYGGGAESTRFYLWNGGFIQPAATYKQIFTRQPVLKMPVADVYHHADSTAQAATDNQIIFDAVASGKLDTTGSAAGVYYKIIKEGTGGNIAVSDTVVAYYTGSLLNGETFDATKDKPASFPLSRLIKGWQQGLPLCRVGGKIRLIIPSGLAYSIRTRSVKIPPNSVLVFDIEVVEVKKHKS